MCQVVNGGRFPHSWKDKMHLWHPITASPLDGKKEGWVRNEGPDILYLLCKHTKTGLTDRHALKPGEALVFEDEVELTPTLGENL